MAFSSKWAILLVWVVGLTSLLPCAIAQAACGGNPSPALYVPVSCVVVGEDTVGVPVSATFLDLTVIGELEGSLYARIRTDPFLLYLIVCFLICRRGRRQRRGCEWKR
jgi:hypothetical protein